MLFTSPVFLFGFLTIYRTIHSPFGEVLRAIREHEPRMISLGYNVDRYKWLAFVLSAALAYRLRRLSSAVGRSVSMPATEPAPSGR